MQHLDHPDVPDDEIDKEIELARHKSVTRALGTRVEQFELLLRRQLYAARDGTVTPASCGSY